MANIKRNLVYNFVLSCSQVLIPLLSIPYVAPILGPDGVGRVNFIDSFSYYILVIAEFGITVYGIREVAKVKDDPVKLKALVSELITLHLVSSLVSLVFYAVGIYLLWDRIRDTKLLLFSCSFVLANFFTCEWYFWGQERFGFIAIRSLIIRALGLASIFILIKQAEDYFIYYAIIVASSVLTVLWNLAVLVKEGHLSFRNVNWRRHLPFVWITYLISLFYSIPLMLDNVLLRIISTASAVGIYSFAVKIIRLGTNLLADSFLVFFPRIVSLNKENDSVQLQQKLSLNVQFITLLGIPMGVGFFLIADELVNLFLGNKFAGAVNDLRVLAFYPVLKSFSLFLSNPVLIAHHFERVFLKNLVVSSVLFVVLSLVLAYWFDHFGICLSLIATEALLVIADYVSVRKKLPHLQIAGLSALGHAFLGSLLFIPIYYAARESTDSYPGRLLITIPGCMIIYCVFLLLIRNSFMIRVRDSVKGFVFNRFKQS